MKGKGKGFHACGQWYEMGDTPKPYKEYLKELLLEIRESALQYRNLKQINNIK